MKTALVFGSSGLIGSHLLNQLIENNNYSKIKLFVRSVPEINNAKIEIMDRITNCRLENLENINQELYSRLIKPFYIIFLITISLLIILKSKSDYSFNADKFKIYFFGFSFIIFLESSSKFISTNLIQNLFLSTLPIFFTLSIYVYFLIILKPNKT